MTLHRMPEVPNNDIFVFDSHSGKIIILIFPKKDKYNKKVKAQESSTRNVSKISRCLGKHGTRIDIF